MSLRFQGLESRIAKFFLALIVVVQVLGLLVLDQAIDRHGRAAVGNELNNGAKLLRSALERNAEYLRFDARALARDTVLVQAIGNQDRAAMLAAANAGGRLKGALTMVVSADRSITVSTDSTQQSMEKRMLGMLDQAAKFDGISALAIVDKKPYHVVAVPVDAPIVTGFVMMALPIEHWLVTDMDDLSSLQMVIVTQESGGPWLALASTFANTTASHVARQLPQRGMPGMPFDLEIEGSQFNAKLLPIGIDGGMNASVLLAGSIDNATSQYGRLLRLLVGLALVGVLVATVACTVAVKRIASLSRQLAISSKQQRERGNTPGKMEFIRDDEIGELAQAFYSMREGMAKREQEIRRLAYWDPLTDLPNRAQFVLLMDAALAEAKKCGQSVFVLMMDLDRFKYVNDVMGHNFGDALLRLVAERVQLQVANGVHASAKVARLGGDEFAVLLPGTNIEQAQGMAGRILAALETPMSLEDQTVDIGAGLGIAGYPAHAADSQTLLSMAEVAMYEAKQRKDGAVVYDPMIDNASEKNLSLLSELRCAVERNEFRLRVQPKVRLDTGQVVGFEALVRWVHPERGYIFPDEFIPFAEQTGFIRILTRWVLEQSAALCQELASKGVHLKVSVNLSTRDLLDQDLPIKFGEILARYQLAPSSFCLEITESAIMDDPVRAQQTLERLHAMGVDLSIDDFGTGYSSLAYLKRLPVDELKIDKSFVLNMEHDIGDTKIVRSTIDLGHNMGLRVVAEGIESEAVWHLLAELGCDQAQGYFMSRPIPGDQLIDWIATWRAPTAQPAASALVALAP